MNIELLSSLAKIPTQQHNDDAGYDLYSPGRHIIYPHGGICDIPIGIKIELPIGFCGFVWPRSGLSGSGVDVLAGLIDQGYRGEIIVRLINHGVDPVIIKTGDRVAQLVITKYYSGRFQVVDSIDKTERGSGGFGSTGK